MNELFNFMKNLLGRILYFFVHHHNCVEIGCINPLIAFCSLEKDEIGETLLVEGVIGRKINLHNFFEVKDEILKILSVESDQ